MRTSSALLFSVAFGLFAVLADGHHSAAPIFDTDKLVAVEGVVPAGRVAVARGVGEEGVVPEGRVVGASVEVIEGIESDTGVRVAFTNRCRHDPDRGLQDCNLRGLHLHLRGLRLHLRGLHLHLRDLGLHLCGLCLHHLQERLHLCRQGRDIRGLGGRP